ncbi:MAG: hypothetical protein A3J59_04230 [Candidatus Buchananbacteria bacterium RIFCSPHIGHO2_02_FULL_56_16]|uniref:Uncharacterized protein n=1 Tax=Candidatus Buchananbacteria bacterium RIFCSPHIGHO2_02_FULL_56_16 TaxID=1797542 RepID=A0A1G1YM41_9BACT|nr:MAG: hypothetical protein A3J59_04230 [Candidatus Buchananbacteria bacterium RIFCSPHIGHO2_02_FULL_56_16]
MANRPISQQLAASVRPVVIVVMQALPDRKRDPQEVVDAALAAVSEPEQLPKPELLKVKPIVRRLVKLSPRDRGIYRLHKYWRLVFHFLPPAETLKYYLKQFANNLTDNQRHQMERYLKAVFKLNDTEVAAALSSFGTRQSLRKKPTGCYGWI